MSDINPGVRLLEEGSGDLIGLLPPSAAGLSKNDEVVYGPSGEAGVTYKIEKVRFVSEYGNVGDPGATRYTVYGRTDLIVSEV